MTQHTDFLVAAAGGTGAIALLAAAAIRQAVRHQPAPTPAPAVPDPTVWLACHTGWCAHNTRPHDPTPTGPVCRTCGDTKGGTQ